MTNFRIEGVGISEFKELMAQIKDDFGPKDANSILRNAVRLSMQPVLETAKALVPKDTGQLAASLQIEARKPTQKDKASKYVSANDVVIGRVTVAPSNKFKKGVRVYDIEKSYAAKKDKFTRIAFEGDGRAMFTEFGTAKESARPYLRPALESNSATITTNLGNSLRDALAKYKAKQARKTL